MTDHDPNRDVDAWLRSLDDPQPSAHLQRAIAEIPLRHPHAASVNVWWPFGSVWKGVVAATMVCVLGVIAGAASVDEASVTDTALNAEATSIDDTWNESGVDLAFALPLDEELSP